MVDSYEIYGDNQDESELEDENFINQRGSNIQSSNKYTSGRRHDSNSKRGHDLGEHIVESGKAKKDERGSSSVGQRRASRREASGMKKTNIEVLDHETPIEHYKQYYRENNS